jgi:uncharacterized membrane protein
MNDWERAAALVAGAALLARAARQRGWAGGLAGAAFTIAALAGYSPAHAITGRRRRRDDPRRALSGSRGLRVEESVTIARPIEEVFAFWRDLTNLPRFMTSLDRVEMLDARTSRWVVKGPAGKRFMWDAEIINIAPPTLIAWQSLPNADVATAGSVTFRPVRAGTEVRVLLQYDPPAGKVGAALAWIAGQSPVSQLREDLRRFKQILEAGETATSESGMARPKGSRVFEASA